MAESIEQLSFELTADALAEQERALAGLRARAGTVLAAASIADAYRAAGIWVESHLETNRRKIVSLSDCLAASCALLVAEVILWTLSLVG